MIISICISTTTLTHGPGCQFWMRGIICVPRGSLDCGLDQPWDILQQRITSSQPPWPLENEFACRWPSPHSLAQIKCQLDHQLNTAFVSLSIFGSQTRKRLLVSFLKKKKGLHTQVQSALVDLCGHRKKPVHGFIRETQILVIIQLSGKSNFVVLWTLPVSPAFFSSFTPSTLGNKEGKNPAWSQMIFSSCGQERQEWGGRPGWVLMTQPRTVGPGGLPQAVRPQFTVINFWSFLYS